MHGNMRDCAKILLLYFVQRSGCFRMLPPVRRENKCDQVTREATVSASKYDLSVILRGGELRINCS